MAAAVDFSGIPVWRDYPYTPPPELDRSEPRALRVLIVGGGPIGLALALDLGQRGHQVLVLNTLGCVTRGSKAICFSKRTLDIWDRLGIGERLVAKGVVWDKGKVFWKDQQQPIYEFDLLPLKDQKNPAFINLQQYYAEEYFLDELETLTNVEVRWRHSVTAIETLDGGATRVTVNTPDGDYQLDAEYLLACDGHKSPLRSMLGLDFTGRVFEDNFLIADVRFKQQRPAERWFRFDPPYPGDSSLVHKQPDGVWRLDFQLGWDVDKREAVKPENVDPFVRGLLGPDIEFEYEWISVYTFQCRRMERFVHGNILFAGDAAHLVSPFGARGCNGGYADADNLVWKLDRVLRGEAPPTLLESYNHEALLTADENILNSTRSTDFMTPKSTVSKVFRDAVLELSKDYSFARPLVNSGRLSTPVSYPDSPLNTADEDFRGGAGPAPGSPCVDAPLRPATSGDNRDADHDDWLLSRLGGCFALLCFSDDDAHLAALAGIDDLQTLQVLVINSSVDASGLARQRYGVAADGEAFYLVRPDQYVAARWRNLIPVAVAAAYRRAAGLD